MQECTLIGTVHDEALSLINVLDITESTLDTFNKHLCACSFSPGLPLEAEGYIAKRYKK
jgi:hypothetical protein